MRRIAGVAALAAALSVACDAGAAPCRGYPESVRPLIIGRIEALRMLEREAADRLAGLDTRTYPYLAGEARKVAEAVASPAELADEVGLDRCRNFVEPVRRVCREAALMLATVLDAQEAGAATNASRQAYAQAMPRCERQMNLPPLNTAIRVTN